jgi:hypothetical protein
MRLVTVHEVLAGVEELLTRTEHSDVARRKRALLHT